MIEYIVDRIENDIVVLEDNHKQLKLEDKNYLLKYIPNLKEGIIIELNGIEKNIIIF